MIYAGVAMLDSVSIMLTIWIYLYSLPRRSHFFVRALLSWAICYISMLSIHYIPTVWYAATEFALFVIVLGMALFCCRASWVDILYCVVWSVMTTELAYELAYIAKELLGGALLHPLLFSLFTLLVSIALCIPLYFGIARHLLESGLPAIGPRQITGAFITMCFFIILYVATMQPQIANQGTIVWSSLIPSVLLQVYCITGLYLQAQLFKVSRMEKERDALNMMYTLQKQQYAVAKSNIQLINQRCHALQVKMAEMRRHLPDQESQENLRQLERSIRVYDATVRTGNEVLDMVLTEKSLLCAERKITVNCVADGSQISFLQPVDLYTVFSGALDNAIEEVSRFAEEERRLIDVGVFTRQNFLVVNFINPVSRPPEGGSRDVRPNYGLKSIRQIVERYDGLIDASMDNGVFNLRLVIPIPPKT